MPSAPPPSLPLHGQHLVAGQARASDGPAFFARDPSTGQPLPTPFHEATDREVEAALAAADESFPALRGCSGAQRAALLEAVATELEALGDALLQQAHTETGLPLARLQGERARTLNQARIFAAMAREGSWVAARIDHGDPARTPLPKPDVRAMLTAVGPVVVFGASNFPLAISVAGTDTVSALAAGCPVVVKAHPAHPGTSELVGAAIARAVAATGLPGGCFSMLHGQSHAVGLALVRHPATKAVAFTGSLRGGRALFDAAAARPVPIPVYAEMGSLNPVFLLPGALRERGPDIARAFVASMNMGAGQFCTKPGLVFGAAGAALDGFLDVAATGVAATAPATLLHAGILRGFEAGVARLSQHAEVRRLGQSEAAPDPARTQARSTLLSTTFAAFTRSAELREEVFGPSSIVVACGTSEELLRAARELDGHLTASVHGTPEDLRQHRALIEVLETKVGRIVFNGFGTGIEVCAAMNHAGPYPACTLPAFTSIGHASIYRFARPVAYQGFPDEALPPALQEANPLGIWRLVDGTLRPPGAQRWIAPR